MEIIFLDIVDSTNNWLISHEEELSAPVMVRCKTQSAGRGQRGNSWESESGKNFTGSILFHPVNFHATSQFFISEAIALAVVKTLKSYGIDSKVKWPNDIYVGDKKICGILTEHVILGNNISRTISGIGINVNQEIFLSDAPNPVSMKILTGKDYDLNEFSDRFSNILEDSLKFVLDKNIAHNSSETPQDSKESIHKNFLDLLWRFDDTYYPFIDKKNNNEKIYARIVTVAPDGMLTLELKNGDIRKYAFKEVEFIV